MKSIQGLLVLVGAALIASCTPALDWREFRADDGAFVVLMPQRPGQSEKKLATPAGEVTMRMYSVRVEETVLGAGYADFAVPPDGATREAMQAALLRNVAGSIVSDTPVAGVGMAPGREVVKRGRIGAGSPGVDGELRVRFYVKGNRYYQLVAAGRQGALPEADLDMFMSSLKPG